MGYILSTATAAIAASGTISAGVFLGDKVLCGIQMPAAWTAAGITFQTSFDNGTSFHDLLDSSGSEIAITSPAADQYLSLDPADFAGVQLLKIRSGVSAAAVEQADARTLTLISRKFFPGG